MNHVRDMLWDFINQMTHPKPDSRPTMGITETKPGEFQDQVAWLRKGAASSIETRTCWTLYSFMSTAFIQDESSLFVWTLYLLNPSVSLPMRETMDCAAEMFHSIHI